MPYAMIEGGMMYYDVQGSGTPLILIHPPLLTSAVFRNLAPALAGRFRVITFDVRGHGRSRYSYQNVNYNVIGEDVIRLMNLLGIEKAWIGGYSTGGGVALDTMLTHRTRFDAGLLLSAMSETSSFFLRSEIKTAVRLSKPFGIRLLNAAISLGNASNPSVFRKLFGEAKRGDVRNIHQYYKHSLTFHCTNRLHELEAPMLLLYGAKDFAFKRYARILHEELPNSELYFVPKVRHQLPTKAVKDVSRLVLSWEAKVQQGLLQAGHPAVLEADVITSDAAKIEQEALAERSQQEPHH